MRGESRSTAQESAPPIAAAESAAGEPRPAVPTPPAAPTCACPADARIARCFDQKSHRRRTAGEAYALSGVSRRLLAALIRAGPYGHTLLELGCGPGALLTELLAAGARRATGIDLSAEAIEEARARTRAAGFADRVTLTAADGARVPLEPHDWVVLDRVFCCYPDLDALLANSVAAVRNLYAFAVPASYGWRGFFTRIFERLERMTSRLRGGPCPGYVHDVTRIERRLAEAGFRPSFRATHRLWHVAVFVKAA